MENQLIANVSHTGSPAKRLGGPRPISAIISQCLDDVRARQTIIEKISVGLILVLVYCLFLGLRGQSVSQHPSV